MNSHEALHPPDYRPGALHIVLTASGLIGKIPPLMLTPAWLALTAIACWPWGGLRPAAAILSMVFVLLDGMVLAFLPRLGRSFGPVTPPLLALTILRTMITFAGGLLLDTLSSLIIVGSLQTVIAAVSMYATWIEPFQVRLTRASLTSPKLRGRRPLRLLHISDLHIERLTPREERLLRLVENLKPDLVVLTGDYLNLSTVRDLEAHEQARQLLINLRARASCPFYAITGSPPVDLKGVVPEIFAGLDIEWLIDDVAELTIHDQHVHLAGLRCTRERMRDAPRLRRLLAGAPHDQLLLLLYHSPDLMPEAVELGVDLYLCGHTHGGQLRLPLYGALLTSSDFGKRYEMGRYEEAHTTMYVSRGLGMEGLGAPRARFLSPPEIVLWTLSGESNRHRSCDDGLS